jgi:hypothetical protein
MNKFIKKNKTKIIIIAAIIVFLLALFLIGFLSSGKDLNYIPI